MGKGAFVACRTTVMSHVDKLYLKRALCFRCSNHFHLTLLYSVVFCREILELYSGVCSYSDACQVASSS